MANKSIYLAGFAIVAADGFKKTGLESAPKVGANDSSPLPDLIAGAVNISLSIELYIKAISLISKRKPQKTHDLKKLYNKLSADIQASVSSAYQRELECDPVDESDLSIRRLSISPNRSELRGMSQEQVEPNPSLEELLSSHNDTFEIWRYIHELSESARENYVYNFRAMRAASNSFSQAAHVAAAITGQTLQVKRGPMPD